MQMYDVPEDFRELAESVIEEATDEEGGVHDDPSAHFPNAVVRLDHSEVEDGSRIDYLCKVLAEKEALCRALTEEVAELRRASARAQFKADRLREFLAYLAESRGVTTLKGRVCSVSLRQAPVPSIRWEGPGGIPAGYARTVVELDGRKAQDAFRSSQLPEGFSIKFARITQVKWGK